MSKITQHDIDEAIRDMNPGDQFNLAHMMRFFNLDTSQYAYLKQAISRSCDKGIAKAKGGRTGEYIVVDAEYDILNFKHKNPSGFFPIKYPFALEQYVNTPRRSLVIIGGSPQAGKTAFVHNIINLNWRNHKMVCWDSENSGAELEERLAAFPDFIDWPDRLFRSKSQNFDDVIEPDAINIIDYLEAPENLWEIRRPLRQIRDKLKEGIAIVCLQKPEGRDLPYGKEWTKQLPRLVVVMEAGMLKILKGKSWVKRDVNPDGLRWSYKLVQGETFVMQKYLGKEA